ncbi:MAG: AraC family transcriptional regulator [Devosia sp.]
MEAGRPYFYREDCGAFAFTYAWLPDFSRWEGATESPSFAIDFAFTASGKAAIARPSGRIEDRFVPARTGGTVGPEGFTWLAAEGPSEVIEVRPSVALRADVAEGYDRNASTAYGESHANTDPFLFAMANRLRAHALGGALLSDLEGEVLVQGAVARTIERTHDLPRPAGHAGLDGRRLKRAVEFLHENMHRRLTIAEVASVAAVSRDHFDILFRRSAGVSAHAYLTDLRMDRALRLLQSGTSVEAAAHATGYAPAHAFRTAFRARFGVLPSEV